MKNIQAPLTPTSWLVCCAANDRPIFFHRVEKLYNAVIYVRLPVMAVVAWLYMDTHDPLFLVLVCTVLPGVVLSSIAKWYDVKKK